MMNMPRIHLRRFARPVWEDILTHTNAFELELDAPKAVGTVIGLLRRYQKKRSDAFFVITIANPCLLRIERCVEMPTNPMTGKPCALRLDAKRPVDEEGVVSVLAHVTDTFSESISRRAFREFLAQRFETHVLKARREWRRLGLDHAAMCALARGMFEKSVEVLESQAVRALSRADERVA